MALKSGDVTAYGTGMRNLSRCAEAPTKYARISRTAHYRTDTKRHRPLQRNQLIDRVEVLSKVKALFLIPGIEMMSARMVADFYEVSPSVLRMLHKAHKGEIDPDGVEKLSVGEFERKITLHTNSAPVKIKGRPGLTTYDVDGVTVETTNSVSNFYSPRAVLRIGMLLRDSEVAKEVRTQPITPDVKTIR